jgi:hypothetical protein
MDINPVLTHVIYSRADYADTIPWLEANVGEFNVDWYKLGRDPMSGLFPESWPGDEYHFRREQDAWEAVKRAVEQYEIVKALTQ